MPELPDVEVCEPLVGRACVGKVIAKADAIDQGNLASASPAALRLRDRARPRIAKEAAAIESDANQRMRDRSAARCAPSEESCPAASTS